MGVNAVFTVFRDLRWLTLDLVCAEQEMSWVTVISTRHHICAINRGAAKAQACAALILGLLLLLISP